MEHATAPRLAELIDNGFVAAVLAATERACIAGTAAFSGATNTFGNTWLNFDTYRIAAVHDRVRLAARVAEDKQRLSELGKHRTITDIVEAIVIADVFDYSFYRADSSFSTRNARLLHDAVEAQRSRPPTLVEQCYLAIAHSYDDTFDPAAHTGLVRPERPGTVRCDILFPAIYSATAEYLAHTDPEWFFRTGEDIVADAAVARHLTEHGAVTFDRLDDGLRSTDDAARALLVHVLGVDGLAADALPTDHLNTHAPTGWFTSLRAPLADDALLTESGAHYLLDRAGELAEGRTD